MAEDYTKVRSGKRMKRGSKVGSSSYKDYGKRDDRYAKSVSRGEMKELKDGTQAGHVYDIPTDTEKADMGRIRYDSVGMKGYSRQAFDYDY